MSDIVYLTVISEQQGAISAGCGTESSVGNRWQIAHEDEIFVFSLSNSMTSTGKGSQLHGLRFCKLIDKSTPLFANAINNNEQLFIEFYFYRINRFGKWEKYYYIQLRGAFLSDIQCLFSENRLPTETINVSYEYILCKHLIANTEFSYLALPENYNRLFIPQPKRSTDSGLKTLNSKAVGRLLAAGGIYNGNIEGFRDTAEKLGGDASAGYKQVLNEKTIGLGIAAASILFARKQPNLKELEDLKKVKWVDENAGMSQRARNYNDSATGARSNIHTQKGQAPTIDRTDTKNNNRPVRFDGVDGNVMIDRKISVVTTQKAKDQAIRQSDALKNNKMTGRWEVPNQTQANRAQKMFDELGIKNIEVKIVKEQ
ncbi:TPA: type VI secretion system tube protein TssD [Salmonella enterica]|uniref:type VI secretion system tube protein TssD n=1 Tax=Salmonella enterica TaxID=28901 RepID=UPI001CEC67D9|nr:type VI secretion system tube protein TssD [Salmonella enterica]MDQ6491057.1 type VI secretion system tube protein TssD [Salmonella enterica]MDQ6535349.1 type VI secretion system tube protein TssD [Salmonella enterica]MDV2062815.1 type VI secretion system tube protein TssD [Salmonella enterica]